MTLMLASVTSRSEAETVLAGGADIIDLKDPSKGSLGQADPLLAAEIVRAIGKRRPISAAAGIAGKEAADAIHAAAALADAGIDYVKVGFRRHATADCITAIGKKVGNAKLAGVLFADEEPNLDLLGVMAESGFAGAMLDTAHKDAGRLLDHMEIAALRDFIGRCRRYGLMAGLAGSLEAPDVPRLLPLRPDYLGFRGSLCRGKVREGAIDPEAVRIIRDLIPREESVESGRADEGTGWHVFWGRGLVSERPAEADRVFVHDLVLPCAIGAYDFERGQLQNVRFNVDVDVRRPERHFDDIRAVFSYDLIIDAIKLILGQGHIDLIETLASQIADEVLRYPPVLRVCVRIEKLDVAHGTVGIEIRRERVLAPARHIPVAPGNAA
jgi:dihydroneopterin aldolase